ncbi:hypothetical protein PM082_019141 [Marasmius tenuissimus]|nr:hypothetical protein PM082_019141 [Marasmius tenuissimus]
MSSNGEGMNAGAEVTPDNGKDSEAILTGVTTLSSMHNAESAGTQTNTSRSVATGSNADAALVENGTGPAQSVTLKPKMKPPQKRSFSDVGGPVELQELAFSSNAHTGATGVNGMAKAKPSAKRPKIDEGDLRDPPCFKCKESNIPCIGSATRSSCNACFQHHWKCTIATPPVKLKKKNNAVSSSALKNLLSDPVSVKSTRSHTAGSRSNGTASRQGSSSSTATPPPSASISAPPTFVPMDLFKNSKKAQATAPAHSTTPSYLPSDPPVLMLVPPSISASASKSGGRPLPAASKSASASTSTIPSKRKGSNSDLAFVGPKTEVTNQPRLERPRRKAARGSGNRSKPYIEDSDSDLYDEVPQIPASEKGKQRAVAKPAEIENVSDLSTPPSSKGSTPDPMGPNSRPHISLRTTHFPSAEPRTLPTNSNLPAVITTLNALTDMAKTMRMDMSEVKETSATMARSQSALDWEIALDKLDRQDKVIQDQSKTIERQGQVISALVKSMKEMMGDRFNAPDFDLGDGGGNVKKDNCEMANHAQILRGRGDLVPASASTDPAGPTKDLLPSRPPTSRPPSQPMPPTIYDRSPYHSVDSPISHGKSAGDLVPVERMAPGKASAEPIQPESVSRPTLYRTTSNPNGVPVTTGSNGLPPPRATSFMWAQHSTFPRSNNSTSPQRRKSNASSTGSVVTSSRPKSTGPGVPPEEYPKFSKAQWSVRPQRHEDSEEERDELLDDSPAENSSQPNWVKAKMMAMM